MATGPEQMSAAERRALRRDERWAERDAQRRADERVQARASAGIVDDGSRRSLKAMAEARSAQEEYQQSMMPQRPRLQLVVGALLVAGGLLTVAGQLLYGTSMRDGAISTACGALATIVGGSAWLRAAPWAPRRLVRATLVTGCVLAALFGAGALTQVVIDGRPVVERSERAETYRLASRLEDELDLLTEVDELLALDSTQARVRIDDFEGAETKLSDLISRWSGKEGGAPNEELAEAITSLRNAAGLALDATEAKRELTLQYDARRAGELDSLRAAFISEAVRAGGHLRAGASAGGVDLGPPVEVRE